MIDARSSAYHQAGHGVMSWLSRMEIPPLSLSGRAKPASCAIVPPARPPGELAVDRLFAWKEEREAVVRVILAGVIAQDIGTSDRRSDYETESDFQKARKLIGEVSGSYSELVAYLQLLCVQTVDQLRANWASVDAVATELLARRRLEPGEVAAIIAAAQLGTQTAR